MKVKFKYNVGDTVTLMKKPSDENRRLGKYICDNEFTQKTYEINNYKCIIIGAEEPKILYNLYAYCDEYLQFINWIPEDDLSGTINEHEEDVEFISHDKEILSIGDDVIASAFYGDYENSYLSPSLTFTYVGTIVGFEYENNAFKQKSNIRRIRRAIIERHDGTNHAEFTPYLVKKMDENFAFEYVKFCKRNRFNPIKESEKQYSKNKKFLEEIHLWDKVLEIYKNWNKYRKDGKVTEKKKTVKKEKPSEKMKDFIYKIANICYEVSKLNSGGRVEPNYSMQQIFDCFDAFEDSDEKGREYYKKLEEYVNKNGSPEKNGLMYSPKLD